MRTTHNRPGRPRTTALTASLAGAALLLSACGDGGGDDTSAASGDSAAGGGTDTITMGFLPSWSDGLSMAYLLEHQLEQVGYTVEMQTLTDAAPLYTGLANGDVDVYPSAWPEVTHAEYMEEYGDRIEDLGTYYDNAVLTIAVPEYVDIDSLEELAADPDRFGGRIVGIEPGAGLTGVTEGSMMPAYGLEGDYELVTSSTAAMLSELQSAIDDEEDIVVTLWRPFWAYSQFPLKDLEDPQGAMGDPEGLHFLGTEGFAEEFPEVADYIGSISLTDEQYGSLEDMVVNEYGEGKESEAVQAWIEQNPDVLPELPAIR
jgi:glycine betaine/proline transport system substrate-binding protein